MSMKIIRSAWKELVIDDKFRRADLEMYVREAKAYLTTNCPGHNGLCYYADTEMGEAGNKSAYTMWSAISKVKGSVAQKWQNELDHGMHVGGRHPARIKMVNALIVELEAIIEKDKRKR